MIAGAVGFQCPECVAAGMRQTRQLALPFGGTRSRDPRWTSFALIGLNVAVWLAIVLYGGTEGPLLRLLALQNEGMCIQGNYILGVTAADCPSYGGQWWAGVTDGAWWQVITSAFVHLDWIHIAFNMVALYVLGPELEKILGRIRFLTMYFVSALMGSAFVLWLSEPHTTTAGASGAIFGMMGSILLVAWKLKANYQRIGFWIGLNIAITFFGSNVISWQGHLGGFVGGLAVTAALVLLPKQQRSRLQWPLTALVAVVALAAIIAKALAE